MCRKCFLKTANRDSQQGANFPVKSGVTLLQREKAQPDDTKSAANFTKRRGEENSTVNNGKNISQLLLQMCVVGIPLTALSRPETTKFNCVQDWMTFKTGDL